MNEKSFRETAQRLLDLAEAQERGEISERELLREWKRFMRACASYFSELEKQIKLN